MNTKFLLFIAILAITISALNSCRKCMCCRQISGYIICSRGADTITKSGAGVAAFDMLNDTANAYASRGYTCTYNGWNDSDFQDYCSTDAIQQQKAIGNLCTSRTRQGDKNNCP